MHNSSESQFPKPKMLYNPPSQNESFTRFENQYQQRIGQPRKSVPGKDKVQNEDLYTNYLRFIDNFSNSEKYDDLLAKFGGYYDRFIPIYNNFIYNLFF